MAPEVKQAVWKYLKNALASDDDKLRDRGLTGCRYLAGMHFDEIESIRDDMYSLISEYENDCDDFSIKQRCILITTKYLLAQGMYNAGDISKEEFEKVSEKCDKWL